ncbi:MAG: hypothetical protein P1T08_05560 [Acidimicrobiia bacterium]|nr:hypothetical protein [Acidimicrobiia bacterium]
MLVAVVFVTIAALGLLVFSDGTVELLGFEALVLLVVILALRLPGPARRESPPEFRYRRDRVERLPPRLVRFERLVGFSRTSMVDFDHRLLPRLREIADARLLSSYGVTLAGSPERSEGILGAPAWALLRPDRVLIEDVGIPGPSVSELHALVTAIERIESRDGAAPIGSQS